MEIVFGNCLIKIPVPLSGIPAIILIISEPEEGSGKLNAKPPKVSEDETGQNKMFVSRIHLKKPFSVVFVHTGT